MRPRQLGLFSAAPEAEPDISSRTSQSRPGPATLSGEDSAGDAIPHSVGVAGAAEEWHNPWCYVHRRDCPLSSQQEVQYAWGVRWLYACPTGVDELRARNDVKEVRKWQI